MILVVAVPAGGIAHSVLDGERVKLVKANAIFATCTCDQFGPVELPVDWLETEDGTPFEQIQLEAQR